MSNDGIPACFPHTFPHLSRTFPAPFPPPSRTLPSGCSPAPPITPLERETALGALERPAAPTLRGPNQLLRGLTKRRCNVSRSGLLKELCDG